MKNRRFLLMQWMMRQKSVQFAVGISYLALATLTWHRPWRKLALLASAAKRLAYLGWEELLAGEVRRTNQNGLIGFEPRQIDWHRYGASEAGSLESITLPTSLLLKEPAENGELGVLYVSFEYNWLKLLRHPRAAEFFNRYLLVGASSWSPTDFSILQAFQRNAPHPAFIGISHAADTRAYRAAGDGIRPLPLMACDWVDPTLFAPVPIKERSIDLLMVAHWERFKRHDLFFKVLARMPADLHIVLVGRDVAGRTADSMMAMARSAGCKQDIEIQTRIPNREVNALQAQSRCAIITTMREGSCVAVTEAFAANTPVAMMRGAHVGAATHINEQTGMFLDMSTAHRSLMAMIEEPERFSPRSWMTANCSAQVSSRILNSTMREYCENKNIPWTVDLAPLRWVYVPGYLNPEYRNTLKGGLETLRSDFNIELVEYPAAPGSIG